jgi:hypothetical protein
MGDVAIVHNIVVLAECGDCGKELKVVEAEQDRYGSVVVTVDRCNCNDLEGI